MPGSALINYLTANNCTGKLIIPNGVKISMDGDLSIPSTITELIIETGGQIDFVGRYSLRLASQTVLTIQDVNTPNSSTNAALYTPSCNNNVAVYIGTIKYAACTGGGNVCLLIGALIQQGGSLSVDPEFQITGTAITGNEVCTTSPTNSSFNLNAVISGTGTSYTNAPTYAWSVISTPAGATMSFANPTSQSPGVTVTQLGTYTARISVTQNLTTSSCNAGDSQVKYADITFVVAQTPTASVSGGGTLYHDANPATTKTVSFHGINNAPPYIITYNINGGTNVSVTTDNAGNYSITQSSSDPVGTYQYNLSLIHI